MKLPSDVMEASTQGGGRNQTEWAADLDRNGWPDSIGIGGRHESEWVADMGRNTHSTLGVDENVVFLRSSRLSGAKNV